VTGHYDNVVLTRAIELFQFHTLLLPVSIAHPHLLTFLETTLPVAVEKGMGIIGMKVIGGSFVPPQQRQDPRALIRFALSWPVSTVIIGCSTPQEVAMNARAAREVTPFTAQEIEKIMEAWRG
jgi:predicted aldo/keto reductase-like oxidoreductase